MKRRNALGGIVLVMATGMALPGSGCFLFGSEEQEAWEICASSIDGDAHCVAASNGPNDAWKKVAANGGTEPIQMWVARTDRAEFDEWVSYPGTVDAYLVYTREILDYVRVTQGNAESYRATLAGRLGQDLMDARRAQEKIIADKVLDPKTRVESPLFDKVNEELSPLKVELVADKQSMGEVVAIFDKAKLDGAPFASQYKTLVDEFVAYRGTESPETTAYTTLAKNASNAALVELDAIETSILDAAHDASAKPSDMMISAMKLSAQILQYETTSQDAISPHTDFMSTHGAVIPDISSGALRSIYTMLGYMQARVARSDATAKGLLLGIGIRRQALQLLANMPSPARATIANTLMAKASTKFAGIAAVRVDAIAAATAMSSKLGLPYLANRYDEFAVLLQMVPLCDASTSSWREAGCVSMRPKFKDATKYLKVTLPGEIAQGLAVMKNKGVDPVFIDKVEKKLKTGDIKGAALAHDVLLREVEGT